MIKSIIIGGLITHILPQPGAIERVQWQPNVVLKMERVDLLAGHNSIGEPIVGAAYNWAIEENLDFKLGAYFQDKTQFRKRGVDLQTGEIMPVGGIEWRIPITDRVKLTNIITPIITFHGISVDF